MTQLITNLHPIALVAVAAVLLSLGAVLWLRRYLAREAKEAAELRVERQRQYVVTLTRSAVPTWLPLWLHPSFDYTAQQCKEYLTGWEGWPREPEDSTSAMYHGYQAREYKEQFLEEEEGSD